MRSIKTKLTVLVLAAVVGAVLLGALAAGWRDAVQRMHLKRTELLEVASLFETDMSEPLAAGDAPRIRRTLASLARMPDISFARVTDTAGHVIASFGSGIVLSSGGEPAIANAEIGPLTPIYLTTYPVEGAIVHGGVTVGRLVLIADVSSLRGALLDSLASSLAVGAIVALVSLGLALRLQRGISEPIVRLARAMDKVRLDRDYALAVEGGGGDEVGVLVASFNTMLAEIRSRDAQLAAHRDRLEAEVAERTVELVAAREAAEAASRAKSDFLAAMSHEIRTPMNGMMVMAELLTASGLAPRLQRYADVLLKSGQTLLAIINDILDLSKIEAGKLTLEQAPVTTASLLDDVVRLFAERATAKGLDLAAVVEPDVPRIITADPVRCSQIVSNLVNNAIKFTERGGVLLRLAPAGSDGAGRAVLQLDVIDTGIGIPDGKIAGIFEAFSQADQTTTRRFGGTGIGLTVSRRLAEAMGGSIAVVSQEGVGSTFSLTLPVAVIEAAASAPQPGPAARQAVLIVWPEGQTAAALIEAAHAHGLVPQRRDPESVSAADLEGVAGLLASPEVVARLAREGCEGRAAVVVALARLGDGRAATLVQRGDADLNLDVPASPSDVAASLAAIIGGRASLLEAAHARSEAAIRPPERSFAGARALVADDSAVNRELLIEALGRLGIEVASVEDGQAAVAAVREAHFDVVLLDGSMPVMDGFDAARAIRSWERENGRSPVPILAVTAHVIGRQSERWREAGMTDCITKPFTLARLEEAIAHCLAGAPKVAARASKAQARIEPVPDLIDRQTLSDIQAMHAPGDDLVRRMIALYEEHAPQELARLLALRVRDDPDALATRAHALKSLSLGIGARRIAALCETVEEAARSGDLVRAGDVLPAIEACLPETLAALRANEYRAAA